MTREELPHSEIAGSKVASTYPTLIAGNHVLHRLPVPRHPSYALSNLTKNLIDPDELSPPVLPGLRCINKTTLEHAYCTVSSQKQCFCSPCRLRGMETTGTVADLLFLIVKEQF